MMYKALNLGLAMNVKTTTIIYIILWQCADIAYTAVQQANKPIDVNNNIDKLKLFIKNENQKSF